MNKNISIFTIALYVLFFGIAGCTKDNDNGPDEELTTDELRTEIIGKWEIQNFPGGLFTTADATLRTPAGISKNSLLAGRADIVSEVGGANAGSAFIEFLPDGTYLVQDATGNVFSGAFSVESGQTITLTDIGFISDIVFSGNRLDFKLTFSISGETQILEITANKKPAIADSDRTNLLAQTWSVYSEEDHEGNIDLIEDGGIAYGGDDDEYFMADELKITFSKSGTYAVRYFYQGDLMRAETANWRWDPSNPDRFQYAWDDEPFSSDNSATIIELTASKLVIKETWTADGEEYSLLTLKR